MQPSTPMIVSGCCCFELLQPAQGAVDLVLGVLADAARVQQDRVGLAGAIDQLVARLKQLGGDQLAVEHVHLAADGLDVEASGHGTHSSRGERGGTEKGLEDWGLESGQVGASHVVLAHELESEL